MFEWLAPELAKEGIAFVIVVGSMIGLAWIGRRLVGKDGVFTKHVNTMTDVMTKASDDSIRMQGDSLKIQERTANFLSEGSDRIQNTNETVEYLRRGAIAACDTLERACKKNGHKDLIPDIERIRRELNGGN